MTEPTNHSGTPIEILIVEDSPVEAEMLRRILVRAGYRVRPIAKNGEEGLQALREHPCTLVMSDINMPVMNGYQLCHAIKFDEKLWATPVILVTMLSEPKDIIKALDVGADGYITKPYVEDVLLGRIRSLLANPATRKLAEERRRIFLEYGGETHSVAVGSPQMANLMLSVYENSLILNQELMDIQNQLTILNEGLDQKVRERTAALQESEKELRLHSEIEQNMAEAVYLIRVSDGVIVHTNPFFERMFGYGPGELIGKHVSIVNAPGDQGAEAVANEIISSLNQTGVWNGEVHNIRKDGSTFWCHANVFTFEHPQHGKVWLSMHQDITEQKRVEAQLKENEARYRQIIQTSMDGFWISDTQGRILDVNDAYCRMSGYTREELLSMRVADVEAKESPEGVAQHTQKIMAQGYARFETRHRHKDGQLLDIEVSSVHRPGPEDGSFLVFLRDITARKQAETQLAEQLDELKRWYKVMEGRELRVMELKRELNELLKQSGQQPRYLSVEQADAEG